MTRSAARTGTIRAMEPKRSRVTIEFETDATERIAGRLFDERGADLPFHGWLGLASVLERVLEPAREPRVGVGERPEGSR